MSPRPANLQPETKKGNLLKRLERQGIIRVNRVVNYEELLVLGIFSYSFPFNIFFTEILIFFTIIKHMSTGQVNQEVDVSYQNVPWVLG